MVGAATAPAVSSFEPTLRARSPYEAESSRHRKDLIGTVLLGRYRVISLLGEGAMGLIFLGEHVTIGRRVAIKVLKLDAAKHPQSAKARFIREAQTICRVDHENVVWISDFGETPAGLPFFIMEYLEGEDLSVMLSREGPLPWGRVRAIVLQILRALRAAHHAGVIHRDMKPSNCFVLSRGEVSDAVKVLDFGIAKIISGEGQRENPRLTQTGEVVGTAAYMAPEQARGERLDARTDLYAVGIIIYELLTGVRPFDDPNPVVLLGKQVYETPQPPSAVAPDANITSGLDALVLKTLAKAPDERFQTADEMIAAVESVTAPVLARTDLSGQTLMGRYKLVEKIGEGGMGTVYLGRHLTLGRRLAVKVLHEEYTRLFRSRFLQEAKAASQITHDHVVKITDYGELASGQPFLVMEYLDGETLDRTLAREKPLPWARVRGLAMQICRALQAAHDLGIVHRDIKPENIFRTLKDDGDEQLKVLDFGIAKMSEGPKITVTGDIMGTAAYMSPEQARGDMTLDCRTDIYALGVLLYEMLVGVRPFDGVDDYSILYQHVHSPPLSLRLRAPDANIPADAEAVVLQALAKDPAARFASMRDMLSALLAVRASAGSAHPPELSAAALPRVVYNPPQPTTSPTTEPRVRVADVTPPQRPKVRLVSKTSRSRAKAALITLAVVVPGAVGIIMVLLAVSPKTASQAEVSDGPNPTDGQAQVARANIESAAPAFDNGGLEPERTSASNNGIPESHAGRSPSGTIVDRQPEPPPAKPTEGKKKKGDTNRDKNEEKNEEDCDGFRDENGNCIPQVIPPTPQKLEKPDIRAGMAAISPSVKSCSETYFHFVGSTASVRTVVRGSDGLVIGVEFLGEYANHPIATCVTNMVKKAKFRTFLDAEQTFTFNFNL
jgi:serine/threonine-protein kinase